MPLPGVSPAAGTVDPQAHRTTAVHAAANVRHLGPSLMESPSGLAPRLDPLRYASRYGRLMNVSTATARSGRPALLDFDQVLAAAEALAEAKGLDAVSFRALARELGVSAMAVHRATGGIDPLLHAVVSRSVVDAVRGISWPTDWTGVVRLFAGTLRSLLLRHPVVLHAHQRAPLEAPEGNEAAELVLAA